MTLPMRFRPLTAWGQLETPANQRKSRWTFKASWQNTINLLNYELVTLGASELVIEADFRESDIRLDGLPKANARQPSFPGVRLSFESKMGPLQYQTDQYEFWQHNIRGIGLGLEALRAVARYGITQRNQQYTGWLQLEAPVAAVDDFATPSEALAWLRSESVAGVAGADGMSLKQLLRLVAKNLHPDRGGDPAQWAKFDRAKQILADAGMME